MSYDLQQNAQNPATDKCPPKFRLRKKTCEDNDESSEEELVELKKLPKVLTFQKSDFKDAKVIFQIFIFSSLVPSFR